MVLNLRGGRRLQLRDTETDLAIFEQIFLLDDCTLPHDVRPDSVRYVIDAGAHVGCSSLFFAARYPKATILAVEADARNHQQLVRNTAAIPSIKPMLGAVFHQNAPVKVRNPDDRPWGFQVSAADANGPGDGAQVPGRTLLEWMRLADFPRIDLLKLDIEGAELELLENDGAVWLRQVGTLIIELHDDIQKGCSESFRRAVRDIPHITCQRIDNLIWINKAARPPAAPGRETRLGPD